MKRKILLLSAMMAFTTTLLAQKNQRNTAYAITGVDKGHSSWTEVRQVDLSTGEVVKTIYESSQEVEILNARTGKPVGKQEAKYLTSSGNAGTGNALGTGNVIIVDNLKVKTNVNTNVNTKINSNINTHVNQDPHQVIIIRKTKDGQEETVRVAYKKNTISADKPFATTSAALAYDKKHERLYYTPMGINQLRYIDLKSKTPRIYYFEDEAFGALTSRHDVANQITRMVIASDGDGYALTNNAEHLFRFTTGKNPTITDLGSINDAPGNAVSVHNRSLYGGDMIADTKENLYLISANRHVFKIDLDTRTATYVGAISGLPRGFTTNAAIVESGSNIIVASSNSTVGYYKFDLNSLAAEKISASESVFNASDLAAATLVNEKKKKEKKQSEPEQLVVVDKKENKVAAAQEEPAQEDVTPVNRISVYPNPVTSGFVKISFEDQPAGKYQIQFMDIAGKMISTQDVNISSKLQVEEFRHPRLMARGNYLLKVVNQTTQEAITNKILVQ